MGHDERHCKKSGQQNQALQYGEWLRAQGGGKAKSAKEEQRRSPLNQQADDTAMQERMQFGAEDGGYSYSRGGAQSGDNLGNAKRGSTVSMTSEEGEHATQEVCQFQFQIQNSRHDEIESRKKKEYIHGEEGKENNQIWGRPKPLCQQ